MPIQPFQYLLLDCDYLGDLLRQFQKLVRQDFAAHGFADLRLLPEYPYDVFYGINRIGRIGAVARCYHDGASIPRSARLWEGAGRRGDCPGLRLTPPFSLRYTKRAWWFERGGPTRSHPEHGSETP